MKMAVMHGAHRKMVSFTVVAVRSQRDRLQKRSPSPYLGLLLFVLALSLLLLDRVADCQDRGGAGANLVFVTNNSTAIDGPACLDGSHYAFYYSPPTTAAGQERFTFYLEGGGW